ncbi:MAG TPA: hypothetical protein VH969_21465 [Actinophytocola sp.]|jgi:hypothetical protein|uniref:hypothetical protein n=1 Tax=Actinophytocola sp. TaxID=1872138 RepID=UPI002F948FE9
MSNRLHLTRLIVGYAAILATLPYLWLKLAWLSGSTIGFTDTSIAHGVAHDGSLLVLNVVTAGMDLVAVFVALAFTHDWRLPAWLVLVPIWVGTGLLTPVVLVVPMAFTTHGSPFLEPWVQPLVYSGFAWQGVTLLTAFVLYARNRWASVFTERTGDVPRGATHPVQVVLANGAAMPVAAVAALHLAHAAGSGLGLPAGARLDAASRVVEATHGVMALLAGGGILWLVHRMGPRLPFWLPVVMTWLGAGAMFAWGLWGTVNVLGSTVLGSGGAPLAALQGLGKVLAGLVIGLAALVLLAEQQSVAGLRRLVVEGRDQPDEEHDGHNRDNHDLNPHARLRGDRSVHATSEMVVGFRPARTDSAQDTPKELLRSD